MTDRKMQNKRKKKFADKSRKVEKNQQISITLERKAEMWRKKNCSIKSDKASLVHILRVKKLTIEAEI